MNIGLVVKKTNIPVTSHYFITSFPDLSISVPNREIGTLRLITGHIREIT